MYDHYIAVDWAQTNMAVARMTAVVDKISVKEAPANVKELQLYLSQLKGKKILTIEESTPAQWLYTELKSYVDEIIVCDPYRNHLLSEGAKNDKIDATKLVQLLRANLLKPVFHSGDDFIYLRKLVSGYQDLINAGVRAKNQRSAIYRANGKRWQSGEKLEGSADTFVLDGLEKSIESYKEEKKRYEKEFSRLSKKHKEIGLLKTIPGIDDINAVKIVAYVVEPRRFKSIGHFLSYCGLVKLERSSGGVVYQRKNSRYCRVLKSLFKMSVYSVTAQDKENAIQDYYRYLVQEKKLALHDARSATARRIATLALGVLKSGQKFDPQRRIKKSINSN